MLRPTERKTNVSPRRARGGHSRWRRGARSFYAPRHLSFSPRRGGRAAVTRGGDEARDPFTRHVISHSHLGEARDDLERVEREPPRRVVLEVRPRVPRETMWRACAREWGCHRRDAQNRRARPRCDCRNSDLLPPWPRNGEVLPGEARREGRPCAASAVGHAGGARPRRSSRVTASTVVRARISTTASGRASSSRSRRRARRRCPTGRRARR